MDLDKLRVLLLQDLQLKPKGIQHGENRGVAAALFVCKITAFSSTRRTGSWRRISVIPFAVSCMAEETAAQTISFPLSS